MAVPRDTAEEGPTAGAPTLARRGLCWEVRLFGRFQARCGDIVISRVPTRAVTLLLARLAMRAGEAQSREELIALLWPDAKPEAGPRNLRTALSTLRALLEPPGVLAESVICADRRHVWVHPSSIDCDVRRFEAAVAAGRADEARRLHASELLTGYYDEWVLEERNRLAEAAAALPSPGHRAGQAPVLHAQGTPAAPTPLPALPAIDRPWRQLPTYANSFFGREAEALALLECLARRRLVTLTGFAGSGKSRLAVEVAQRAVGFEVVAFVGLVDCRQPAEVLDFVRSALGLQAGATPVAQQVQAFLGTRRVLLVLDNFEQLAEADGLGVVASLLALLPGLRLLVTSRRALQMAEESEFPLQPLPLPSEDEPLSALEKNPCISLFRDRARRSRPEFQVGERNRAGMVALCRALEGLPYQIEIAATRIRAYTPAEMCASITQDSSVLALQGFAARRNRRHASPKVAIEWSWRLLSPRQRQALSALAVFRGGWTPQAARAVTDEAGCAELLEEFQVHSLVGLRTDADGGSSRYDMLEVLREFLVAHVSSRRRALLRQRHRSHFAAWAAELREDTVAEVTVELPNIGAALRSALEDGDALTGATLALELADYWTAQGASPAWLATMLELARALPDALAVKCRLLCLLARLMVSAGQIDTAQACATEAGQCAGKRPELQALAILAHANVDWLARQDGDEVQGRAQQALELARIHGQADVEARAHYLLGAVELTARGRTGLALDLLRSAEAGFRALGDGYGSLSALAGQVQCLNQERRFAEAIDLARLAFDEAEARHQVAVQMLLLNGLSLAYEGTHRWPEAVQVCQRQARIAQRHGMVYHCSFAVWNQCRPLVRSGQPALAMTLTAFAQCYWQRLFGPLGAADLRSIEKVKRLARLQIGASRCARLWAQGQAMSDSEGLRLACG